MILAGDVGGTKAALAFFDEGGGGLTLIREATLPSHEFPSLSNEFGGMSSMSRSLNEIAGAS